MMSEWLSRVGSSVPRGFSRYYILSILNREPCTGKQIIDQAVQQSQGAWKPSPGLVYPLLGRLFDEGLIEENDDGKYKLTEKGKTTAQDISKIGDIVRKQMDVLFRLGSVGQFAAADVVERMSFLGAILTSNAKSMTEQEIAKYRKFLLTELKMLDGHVDESEHAESRNDEDASVQKQDGQKITID